MIRKSQVEMFAFMATAEINTTWKRIQIIDSPPIN